MLWKIKVWIISLWDWFWFYRKGLPHCRVWKHEDFYQATLSNGEIAVWNCYGSTPEAARAMALYRFNQAIKEAPLD